jgi:hypothetical protein
MMLKRSWYFKHHPKKGKNQGFNVFIASTGIPETYGISGAKLTKLKTELLYFYWL